MSQAPESPAGSKPLVQIGLLLPTDERDADLPELYEGARDRLVEALTAQFPGFQWQVPVMRRRRFSPRGAIDPLALLEFAVQEKIARRWDYVLVVVPNELTLRDRPATWGVPSSALEVGLMSTATVAAPQQLAQAVAAMAVHLLGHLWGLDHQGDGPMCPGDLPDRVRVAAFEADDRRAVEDRLDEVADARIEEARTRLGALAFYWRTWRADPSGILTDIWGYAPWTLPLRLGRLTTGALTFLVVLLVTAETWEVGLHVSGGALAACTAGAVVAAALVLFAGQHLGKMSGPGHWHEQLVRTRLVIVGSLIVGMTALWGMLALASFLLGLAMPDVVLARWVGEEPRTAALLRYAVFMATLGLFGGALGGSLEDEANFKGQFLFDRDTSCGLPVDE